MPPVTSDAEHSWTVSSVVVARCCIRVLVFPVIPGIGPEGVDAFMGAVRKRNKTRRFATIQHTLNDTR